MLFHTGQLFSNWIKMLVQCALVSSPQKPKSHLAKLTLIPGCSSELIICSWSVETTLQSLPSSIFSKIDCVAKKFTERKTLLYAEIVFLEGFLCEHVTALFAVEESERGFQVLLRYYSRSRTHFHFNSLRTYSTTWRWVSALLSLDFPMQGCNFFFQYHSRKVD